MNEKKTILIVDDIDDLRYTMDVLLGKKYNTITASNGQEAVEKFKQNNIDLIITDNQMPRMNGIDAVKKIRELNNSIPIIMTVGEFSEFPEKAAKAGVDKLMFKVFNCKEILNAVHNLLIMYDRGLLINSSS